MNKHKITLSEVLKGMYINNWEQRITNGHKRVVYVRYHEKVDK